MGAVLFGINERKQDDDSRMTQQTIGANPMNDKTELDMDETKTDGLKPCVAEIRITKGITGMWYSNQIGYIFAVVGETPRYYTVRRSVDEDAIVWKGDAEIVSSQTAEAPETEAGERDERMEYVHKILALKFIDRNAPTDNEIGYESAIDDAVRILLTPLPATTSPVSAGSEDEWDVFQGCTECLHAQPHEVQDGFICEQVGCACMEYKPGLLTARKGDNKSPYQIAPRPIDGMEERAREFVAQAHRDNCQSTVAIAMEFAQSETQAMADALKFFGIELDEQGGFSFTPKIMDRWRKSQRDTEFEAMAEELKEAREAISHIRICDELMCVYQTAQDYLSKYPKETE